MERVTRRVHLEQLIATPLAVVTTACLRPSQPSETSISPCLVDPRNPDFIKRCYPELAKLSLQARGSLSIQDRVFNWRNYTNFEFNPNAAAKILDFFIRLGRSSMEQPESEQRFIYAYKGEELEFTYQPGSKRDWQLFIAPKQALSQNFSYLDNISMFLPIPDETIRKEILIFRDFAYLAFDSQVLAKFRNGKFQSVGQRIIAISWGIAFAFRQRALYPEYSKQAIQAKIGPITPYIIPQKSYDQMPMVGPLIYSS